MDPDTISCNLERYVRGKCPEYVAISYSWEPLHLAEDTNINGTLHRVSTTVADALRYLRHEDKDRYVWLDQICINQRDDMEKSDQVQHMHAIYSDAERVIAWLGPASEDSNLLFDHMQKTGDALIARDYDSVAQLHEGDDKLKTLAHAFDSICKRKYWQRLWVIQEFAVAKEVLLACGGSSMNMKTVEIVMLASNASRYPNDEGEPPIDADLLRKLASVYLSPAKSFAENLVSRRQRYHYVEYGETFNYFFRVLTTSLVLEVDYNWPMTTDPRDRIFALLNLAHDAAEFPAFPDYSMTCQKVYTEAAFRLLEQGHIDLLCYSQFPKTFKYLPSTSVITSHKWKGDAITVAFLLTSYNLCLYIYERLLICTT